MTVLGAAQIPEELQFYHSDWSSNVFAAPRFFRSCQRSVLPHRSFRPRWGEQEFLILAAFFLKCHIVASVENNWMTISQGGDHVRYRHLKLVTTPSDNSAHSATGWNFTLTELSLASVSAQTLRQTAYRPQCYICVHRRDRSRLPSQLLNHVTNLKNLVVQLHAGSISGCLIDLESERPISVDVEVDRGSLGGKAR